MKFTALYFLPLCLWVPWLLFAQTSAAPNEQPVQLPYFGQKEPALVPQLFAPGIVSVNGRYEYGVNFSPDLSEMYFSPTVDGASVVYVSRRVNNQWTEPKEADFTAGKSDNEFGAMVSNSGRTIHFSTYSEQHPLKIWSVSRDEESWGEATLLDSPINEGRVSFASQAWNLDLFYNNHDDGKLYIAPRINRGYPKTRELAIAYGTHGHISPSMDYLLVEAHKNNDASTDQDIIVYFKKEDGTWSEPLDLGEAVNTGYREGSPTLTPDGKYLFFSRYDEPNGNPNVYWVSADIIHKAKENWLSTLPTTQETRPPEIAEFDPDNLGYGFEQSLPNLRNGWIDPTPSSRNDQITVGQLASIGDKKADVLAFAKDLANHNLGEFDSLLIAHKDQLIFESYVNKGRVNLPHFQASATKGYTTMVVARAMQMGYISMEDLHRPIVQIIDGLDKDKLTNGAEAITLHNTMNMRSGVRVNDQQQDEIFANNRQVKGSNIIQQFLQHSEDITSESQTFDYQGFDPRATMQVVASVIPSPIMDFVHDEVLTKLGIADYGWRKDANGVPTAGSGSAFTSRDMLKIGLVVLRKGKWQGEQLFSAQLLEKATSAITQPPKDWMPDSPNLNYGYYWYQIDLPVDDKTLDVTLAWGAGGNRVIVVDELELVIVITGFDREDNIMTEIEKRLIPAFVN